jgi:hypothetical protein
LPPFPVIPTKGGFQSGKATSYVALVLSLRGDDGGKLMR